MFADLVPGLIGLVVILAVCIGVFLALRQVTLWYFRINEMADNIAVIADYYRNLKQTGNRQVPGEQPQASPPQTPKSHPLTGKPLP